MRALALCGAVAIAGALACCLPIPAHADEPDRFHIRAEVRTLGLSEDHRYALGADLRMTSATASADGRYTLKEVRVPDAGCDPLLDLFADGFEGN